MTTPLQNPEAIRKRHSRIAIVTFWFGITLGPFGYVLGMLPLRIGVAGHLAHALALPFIVTGVFLCSVAPLFSDQVWWRKLLFSVLSLFALAFVTGAVIFVYMLFGGGN